MNAAARMVIVILGAFLAVCYVGGVVLMVARPDTPEGILTSLIVTPVTTTLGGLIGMLAKTGSERPQAVEVVNPPSSPVPTTDQAPGGPAGGAAGDGA